ncbi:biotin-dependent carboxylase-like uncharacterized protein [Psychromicrobium silvestre]|uniref:Biotin-dependent carboxylase-like uncharacterized protein n=1 Tax=Psychromicrobium silvestre TaxID=1645614 RepID=A0A7Y9S7L1_9MICC|nr:biotin-dependent carboxyltransferase family protein [Psychromicrobium silvestre]NYE96109.1 biotin-dependent carboxylase-like uncharacterized protein [Psychromicrobium silvestre]
MSIRIIAPGPLALIQDLGRPGAASLGLGPGGALDRRSLLAANALVGNAPSSAGIEILLGGFSVEFLEAGLIAVTGAAGLLTLDGGPVALNTALPVRAGSRLSIAASSAGLRFYLAVSGGVLAEPLAGSLSRDVLAEMGPAALAAGDLLEIGQSSWAAASSVLFRDPPQPEQVLSLRLSRGPRLDWFAPGSWAALTSRQWSVSADSNRIGARLLGQPLEFARSEQLPSEGMVTGALQVPPSGLPTIFLADHPVTGGYPVIAVVRRADLDLLAQARPGQKIRFLG